MRYLKQISTGKIIEAQSGGNPKNPAHLQTLIDNGVSAGFLETDLEVGYEADAVVAGWMKAQADAIPKTVLTYGEFQNRFTLAERKASAALARSNDDLFLGLSRAVASNKVNLEDPDTKLFMQALVDGGAITASKKDEILTP